MKARFQTTNGYSFTNKQLSVLKAIQTDNYLRRYLITWVLGLPEVQAEMKKELTRIQAKYDKDFDTLLVYTLNQDDMGNYGKTRLVRLYRKMIENRKRLKEFYDGDMPDTVTVNADIQAMYEELKQKGITPEELFDEVQESKKCL